MKSFISALACAFFLVLQGCGGGGGGSSDKLAGTWGLTAFPSVESSTCSESQTENLRGVINSLHPFTVERIADNDGLVRVTYANGSQSIANIVQDNGYTFSQSDFQYEPGQSYTFTIGQFFNNSDGLTALAQWTMQLDYLTTAGDCVVRLSTILGKTS